MDLRVRQLRIVPMPSSNPAFFLGDYSITTPNKSSCLDGKCFRRFYFDNNVKA